MPSTSPTSYSRPVSPESMSSGTPPTRVGDGRDAAGHGLQGGQAEGLHFAGHDHEVGERKEFLHVVLLADEEAALEDTEAAGEELGGGAVRAVANEEKARPEPVS